jgi:hypothetical protein
MILIYGLACLGNVFQPTFINAFGIAFVRGFGTTSISGFDTFFICGFSTTFINAFNAFGKLINLIIYNFIFDSILCIIIKEPLGMTKHYLCSQTFFFLFFWFLFIFYIIYLYNYKRVPRYD